MNDPVNTDVLLVATKGLLTSNEKLITQCNYPHFPPPLYYKSLLPVFSLKKKLKIIRLKMETEHLSNSISLSR